MSRLIGLAPTAQIYNDCRIKLQIPARDMIYLHDLYQIQGCDGATLYLMDRYYESPLWHDRVLRAMIIEYCGTIIRFGEYVPREEWHTL